MSETKYMIRDINTYKCYKIKCTLLLGKVLQISDKKVAGSKNLLPNYYSLSLFDIIRPEGLTMQLCT